MCPRFGWGSSGDNCCERPLDICIVRDFESLEEEIAECVSGHLRIASSISWPRDAVVTIPKNVSIILERTVF